MLSSIAKFALDPFHILMFLITGMLLSHWFERKKPFRYLSSIAFLWFLIISTPFIPFAILNSLESRYMPVNIDQIQSDKEVHIIVLGAGYVFNENLPPNSQLDKEMLSRLAEGVRLHHGLKNSTIIVSGPYNHESHSQADVAKEAALNMGVADSLIRTQSDGRTTFEEARVYFQTYPEGHQLVVVTSAVHMHRALYEFRRLGIDAIPSPSSYRYRDEKGLRVSVMPSLANIDNLRFGMFEYAAQFRNYVRNSIN